MREKHLEPGARPEDEILLCCARVDEAADRTERIRALLQEGVDWTYLLSTAKRHGMLPLLYWELNNRCPEAVPPACLDQLRDHFQDNAQRNLVLTRELLRLLDLFEAHQIPAIPFKGPVLAYLVYGNLALRHFADLDLLLYRADVLTARELLVSVGYRPKHNLLSAQEVEARRLREWLFLDRDRLVELHWQLTPRYFAFSFDLERLGERLVPVTLGGREVRTLASEDLLLILCVHGAKHLWERLAWICDVARLVNAHHSLDWEGLTSHACSLGVKRTLLLGLFLANEFLGAELPLEIRQKAQAEPAVRSLAAQVRQRLFAETVGPLGIAEEFPFNIRVRERWRDRLRYVLYKTLLPSIEDADAISLPPAFSFLYYPLRPFRLLVKHWRVRPSRREGQEGE